MCGRFALYATEDQLIAHYKLKQGFHMEPRYNVAPSNVIPVVRDADRKLDFARWGFIPRWVRPEDSDQKGHINARAETVMEKPSFKSAFAKRRCLIPVSGYFEWKTVAGKKQPYYMTLPGKPIMSLAGIWETHQSATQTVDTVAILTVEATEPAIRVHHRMPLLMDEAEFAPWLDSKTSIDKISSLLGPVQHSFVIQPVSTRMNSPKFDTPQCIHPLS